MSERSFRGYRRLRPLVARVLRQLDLVLVQNEEYADRFRALGSPAERVHVTGSIKFDGAKPIATIRPRRRLAQLAGFSADDIVFLAGSTQEPEESLALAAFRELAPQHPRLRLVLVPRHPERFARCRPNAERLGHSLAAAQRLDRSRTDPHCRVLLVDCVGELGAWWGTAQIAFVGGSLGKRGGQNMIEPAAYGSGRVVWPEHAQLSRHRGRAAGARAAIVVHDGAELSAFVPPLPGRARLGRRLGRSRQPLCRFATGRHASHLATARAFAGRGPGAGSLGSAPGARLCRASAALAKAKRSFSSPFPLPAC